MHAARLAHGPARRNRRPPLAALAGAQAATLIAAAAVYLVASADREPAWAPWAALAIVVAGSFAIGAVDGRWRACLLALVLPGLTAAFDLWALATYDPDASGGHLLILSVLWVASPWILAIPLAALALGVAARRLAGDHR